MTIKEILLLALERVFNDEIDDGYYLLVLMDNQNLLVSSSSNVPNNFFIKGKMERPSVLSSVNPNAIEGITIIASEASYWFKIINNDCFEIRCCSNLMGRSGATLLEIQRTNDGKWLVKNGRPLDIVKDTIVFNSEEEMAIGVFDILADYGNPYARCHIGDADDAFHGYLIDVEKATLFADGFCWLSPERF